MVGTRAFWATLRALSEGAGVLGHGRNVALWRCGPRTTEKATCTARWLVNNTIMYLEVAQRVDHISSI